MPAAGSGPRPRLASSTSTSARTKSTGLAERVIAERLGTRRRPASMWEYPRAVVAALFASEEPPAPPVKEPSLRGLRHRVDTDDWHL